MVALFGLAILIQLVALEQIALPSKSRGALGRLISKPGGSANPPPLLAAVDSSLPVHRMSIAAPKSAGNSAQLANALSPVVSTHAIAEGTTCQSEPVSGIAVHKVRP